MLYTYEGNAPHSLAKVFDDHGSLCCEHCGACVVDHTPMPGSPPLDELVWTRSVKVRLSSIHQGELLETSTPVFTDGL